MAETRLQVGGRISKINITMKQDKSISDYPMPSSREAEYQVLGEFVAIPDSRLEVARVVSDDMFSDPKARLLWQSLMKALNEGQHIDLITARGMIDTEFFDKEILSRSDFVGMPTAMAHAETLINYYVRREAYKTAVSLLEKAVEGETSEEIINECESFGSTIRGKMGNSDMVQLDDTINELMEDYEKGTRKLIKTHIPSVDSLLNGGLPGGVLMVIGARPGSGKTALALDLAMRTSRDDGNYACYFTIEMTAKELAQRVMLGTGEITQRDILVKDKEWERFERAYAKSRNKKLYISKKCHTINSICNKIIYMRQQGRCDIAFIDYLQIIKGRGDSLRERYTLITGALKQLAVELEIPIVLMSQLNRDSSKEGRRPYVTDLKESGSIEQDADIVWLLEKPRGEETKNRIDSYIDKNRNGETQGDAIRLQATCAFANFYELTNGNYQ